MKDICVLDKETNIVLESCEQCDHKEIYNCSECSHDRDLVYTTTSTWVKWKFLVGGKQ